MVVTIKKGSNKKDVLKAIATISKSESKSSLLDFFGKLKGTFGDGLEYQKKLRNEWE
jgi:hypothetical protein